MINAQTPSQTAPPAADAIRVSKVSKRFKGHEVLRDIDFTVGRGQSVAVVGLNGAGKTTLLRALLGFVSVDTGVIELFGRPVKDPRSREHVAFLPEKLTLGPDLSGWRSLQLLLGLRSMQADRQACVELLGNLGFPVNQLDAPAREYSKGMSQKIGLVAAMLGNAQLAVLDEPMSGLDPVARRVMNVALQQWREKGCGLLFTAHSFAGLEQLADRLAIIHARQLAFFGSPAELLSRYGPREKSVTGDADALEQAFITCIETQMVPA